VRLRSSASAYFNRTPGVAGNQQKFTWSGWIKLGTLSTEMMLFDAGTGNAADFRLVLLSTGALGVISYNGAVYTTRIETSAVLRDPSAWYHIVFSIDTTQATASNRVLIYINGVLQTALSQTTYMTQNFSTYINSVVSHTIGRYSWAASSYLDGYLTEVNFIDGQALTPTSFGAYNAYGVWSPAKYSGSYGTNGFYLNFQDNSGATATTIGKDSSGNANNWTPNNISVTAGVTYDSMLDVPTLTSGSNANFCVLNPLAASTATTPTQGNLYLGNNAVNNFGCVATFGVSSGKWYWEVKPDSSYVGIGVTSLSFLPANTWPGSIGSQALAYYSINGQKYNNGTNSAYGATFSSADLMGIALDMDAGTITFYKNNVSQGTAFTGLSGTYFPVIGSPNTYNSGYLNFGQRPFSYTPPTGFKRLNTFNLPTPTIPNGAAQFAATTYTATGTTPQTIANTINGVSIQPDLVWTKSRSTANNNILNDSVRGSQYYLYSNLTNAENNDATYLTSFNSNGFSLGAGNFANGTTMVGWQWKANGTPAVTNTSGSIPSTISANTTSGFSIVTWTGNGSTGTLGHGLGVAPKFIITKYRNAVNAWLCYSASLGAGSRIYLNQTDASGASTTVWNNTSPTSSVFSVGDANTNASGGTYVAYCWAEIPGFSKFGSYTGNGSADGPFIYTGFRPRLVMTKRTDAASQWYLMDTARDLYNCTANILFPNLSNAESSNTGLIDELSNGFKLRSTNTDANASGGSYIYMAFAENPFNYSLAR
jgi:hypothetical protein